MILSISDRFRALPPSACPVFLLPVVFLSGFLLGSVLVAMLKPGSVTPGFTPTGENPPLVLRDFLSASAVVQVGRYAD